MGAVDAGAKNSRLVGTNPAAITTVTSILKPRPFDNPHAGLKVP
jgi:hypothetical protein